MPRASVRVMASPAPALFEAELAGAFSGSATGEQDRQAAVAARALWIFMDTGVPFVFEGGLTFMRGCSAVAVPAYSAGAQPAGERISVGNNGN